MAKTMLFGKAALTAIRLTDGTRANLPAGRAVPDSIDPDDAKRLLKEGFLEEVEIEDGVADLDPDELEPEGPNPPTGDDEDEIPAYTDEQLDEQLDGRVDDILDRVGDDADLAAALLDREQAKGDKARSTLVAGLQETIDAADEAEGA